MLHQVACAPGPKSLLVRHSCQREFAFQVIAKTMQISVSKDRGCCAAFHVDNTASVQLAISNCSAPRRMFPLLAFIDREHINMDVEHQMTSKLGTFKGADNIGRGGLWRDYAERQLAGF